MLCQNISTTPNYLIKFLQGRTIQTTGFSLNQDTPIRNIKNILKQNKGVWFSLFLADAYDVEDFMNFWLFQKENQIWDPDPYCGYP